MGAPINSECVARKSAGMAGSLPDISSSGSDWGVIKSIAGTKIYPLASVRFCSNPYLAELKNSKTVHKIFS